eukprot:jgi/Ulvmu1/1412/UM011_0141.1
MSRAVCCLKSPRLKNATKPTPLSKVPSLLFEIELGDNSDIAPDDIPDTSLALNSVTTVLRPTCEFHRQLRRDVQKIMKERAHGTTVMAAELRSMGYQVLLHTTKEAHSYAKCLQYLRHTSLIVSGAGGIAREAIVVDPFFRDQFEMAKATPHYIRLIQSLPVVIVCTENQLRQLVKILCQEMHEVFVKRGISIPPWRSKDSILSKWKLPAAAYPGRDRVLVPAPPALVPA